MPSASRATDPRLQRILDALGGHTTDSGIMVHCPSHPDKTPSLAVTLSARPSIICHCHGGCDWKTVMKELERRDLLPEAKPNLVKIKKGKRHTHTYQYFLPNGDLAFEKLRFIVQNGDEISKTFSLRRKEHGQYFYKGVTKGIKEIPLYNQKALRNATTVYIVEGEKDADLLNSHGLVATCNYDGAGKWKHYYCPHFYKKHVVILADNDPVGRLHAHTVASKLLPQAESLKVVEFDDLPLHGDVSDYLAQEECGLNTLLTKIQNTPPWQESQLEQVAADVAKDKEVGDSATTNRDNMGNGSLDQEPTEQNQPKKIPASYDQYVALFQKVLGPIKVDIFSHTPMYYCPKEKLWTSALNAIPVIRSQAAITESLTGTKFSRPLIEDHLATYVASKTPQFIPDIPSWDGIDRISKFAACLEISDSQDFTQDDVDNLLTDWLVKAWRRIHDPNVRNRILIFKGPQHIGKDWFIDSLIHGADQFTQDLSVVKGDKDCYLQLSRGLFLKISEFDRTARTEVSVLKDMVTKPYTDIRGAYERDTRRRQCRGSFISSCNIDDILRDSTGSTRYIVLDVTKIHYDYPVRDSVHGKQILAQARALAADWKCPQETEEKLAQWLGDRTPEDPSDIIKECYEEKLLEKLRALPVLDRIDRLAQGFIGGFTANAVIKDVARELEIKDIRVRNVLHNVGYGLRTKKARGFRIPQYVADRLKGNGGSLEKGDQVSWEELEGLAGEEQDELW